MADLAHSTHTPETRPEGAPYASGRRSLLAGLAAAALLPAAAPLATALTLEPDAMLLALRDGIKAHQARWDVLSDEGAYMTTGLPREREIHDILVAMVPGVHAMEEQLAETPARSLKGIHAKAESLCLRLSGHSDSVEPMDPEDNLAWSLAQDVLRLLGGAA